MPPSAQNSRISSLRASRFRITTSSPGGCAREPGDGCEEPRELPPRFPLLQDDRLTGPRAPARRAPLTNERADDEVKLDLNLAPRSRSKTLPISTRPVRYKRSPRRLGRRPSCVL